MNDESIWQDSFWSFHNKLMPCVTVNTPIAKLEKPNENQVSSIQKSEFGINQLISLLVYLFHGPEIGKCIRNIC